MIDVMRSRKLRLLFLTGMRSIVGLMLVAWMTVPAHAQRMPIEQDVTVRARPYERFITAAAERHGVDPSLLQVVAYLETRFNPAAVSKRGARGMMQFMPATASRYGLRNPHDPQAALDAAARYLRELSVRFGHRADLVLAAYNAGEGAVEAYLKGRRIIAGGRIINPGGVTTGGVPPYRETRGYVARGIVLLQKLRSASSQQTSATMRDRRNYEESNEAPHSLVRHSLRATSRANPISTSTNSQQRSLRRSIYFGSAVDEK